jgi:hypothetical protein
MMIMMIGVANYTFNELCSFGPGTADIFRKMIELSEAAWNKKEENKKDEDDKLHLHSSSNVHQLHHNSMQSTISDL